MADNKDTEEYSGRSVYGRDWTQGSILGNLMRLSWPMVVSSTLMMLGPTIDMVWVGKLGSAAVAGVGVSGIAVQLVMGAMMGLIMGMRAIIARFIGGGNVTSANHVAQQALVISGGFAVLIAVIGAFLSERILGLFGLEPDVLVEGSKYLRIMFVSTATMSFRVMAEGVMQASGDAITPMATAVVYRVFHVLLCPFLVFGWWVFPDMGVAGAALASVIAQFIGAALGLWFLFTGRALSFVGRSRQDEIVYPAVPRYRRWLPRLGPSRMQLSLRNFRLDPSVIWRIIKIGAPAMVSGMQRTCGQFILLKFISPFGTVALAAHTVAQRVEMVIMMPSMAFGQSAGVLAGQNLGAGKPERAEKSAWLALALVEGIAIIFSIAVLVWPEFVVRIFNTEPELVYTASIFLRIAVVGYAVIGLALSLMHMLTGAGDTIPPMIISVAIGWMVQLPLAYFLPKVGNLGVYGVRWAIVSEFVFGAIAYLTYFRTGRWKRKKV